MNHCESRDCRIDNDGAECDIAMQGPSRLSQLLTTSPRDLPVALRADGTVMTDRAFLVEAGAWAEAFRRAAECSRDTGCCRKRRVAIHTEDTAALLPALFGAWSAGVETVLAGDALPGTLARMRRAAIVEPGVDMAALDMAAFAKDSKSGSGLLAVEAPLAIDTAASAPLPLFGPLSDEAVLCSLFTSGSTGEAKRVPKRLGQLFFETEGVARALHETGMTFDMPTVAVSTVTAQHIYGILFRALLALVEPQLMADSPRTHFPEALAARMEALAEGGRRILLVSSPAHLGRFTEPELFARSRASVVGVTSSAGPLSDDAARSARLAFGHWPLEVLGSTETGGIARRMRKFADPEFEVDAEENLARSLGAAIVTPAWRPMPGVEIGVAVSDTSETADPIETRTAAVATEGVGRIALKARHLAERGWTIGDDAVRLERNAAGPLFTLLGRADRIAKIEGKRVALAEVEAVLLATGCFKVAKVFAVSRGERLFTHSAITEAPALRDELAAVVVPTAEMKRRFLSLGKNAALVNVRRTLLERFSPVVIPKRWRFVERMPVNAQGKTTRAALASLFDPRRPEWLLVRDERTGSVRSIEVELALSPNLIWFRGHFPELPILPGVAQLLLAKEALEEFAGDDPFVRTRLASGVSAIKNLKFKSITYPGMQMHLRLEFDAATHTSTSPLRVKFAWLRSEASKKPADAPALLPHSLGTLEFSAPEPG